MTTLTIVSEPVSLEIYLGRLDNTKNATTSVKNVKMSPQMYLGRLDGTKNGKNVRMSPQMYMGRLGVIKDVTKNVKNVKMSPQMYLGRLGVGGSGTFLVTRSYPCATTSNSSGSVICTCN